MQPVSVIKFENVSKAFGATNAVDKMSFAARAGETVALLGPSGCGKTTTLRLIAGFEEPDSGSIEIAGESMQGKRPYERNVGLLFQHYALFPHMTVLDNIAYGLKRRHWPKGDIAGRVSEMLRLVQLEGFQHRYPRQLSGGQQQRVALARVLATKPKLVLLDEPLSALDAKMREELRTELKQILGSVGTTTIVVTHDQDEAMSLADRIVVMNRGRIEQEGTPDEIYARPQTHFVATFIGRANWFNGTISAAEADGHARLVTAAGSTLAIGGSAARDGAEVSVCVRPERMFIAGSEPAAAGETGNLLPGTIADIVNLGAELHYAVDCADGRMHVVTPNRGQDRLDVGKQVAIAFQPRDCVVLPGTSIPTD